MFSAFKRVATYVPRAFFTTTSFRNPTKANDVIGTAIMTYDMSKDKNIDVDLVRLTKAMNTPGADLNTPSPVSSRKHTLLHVAVLMDNDKLVTLLLNHKADANAVDSDGRSPLYYATVNGRDKIAGLLIEKGADVTKPDRYGHSPLYYAVAHGKEAIATLLVNHKADIGAYMAELQKMLPKIDHEDLVYTENVIAKIPTLQHAYTVMKTAYDKHENESLYNISSTQRNKTPSQSPSPRPSPYKKQSKLDRSHSSLSLLNVERKQFNRTSSSRSLVPVVKLSPFEHTR